MSFGLLWVGLGLACLTVCFGFGLLLGLVRMRVWFGSVGVWFNFVPVWICVLGLFQLWVCIWLELAWFGFGLCLCLCLGLL